LPAATPPAGTREIDMPSNRSPSHRHLRIDPLAWAIAMALAPAAVGALPQDGVVKQGQVAIQNPQAGLMEIKQGSQTAAVDWRSFSVDKGETVNILQPNAQAVLINRVIGYDPTRILGQINANGRVVLSNPRGVYFAAGSQVDVGSLVATTLSLSDADLQSGRLRFGAATEGAGELRMEGQIRAADAVALVAPQLHVDGSIEARRVGLAAASRVTVDVEGDGLVLFNVRNDDNLDTRLNQLGQINATQSAELRAAARSGFADTVLNMEGVVRARSLEGVAGKVVVDGGSQGVTWVNGKIDASGGSGQAGGDVLVQGQRIMLDAGAQLDASGDAGGGRIRVGGDFHGANADVRNAEMLVVRPGARLTADAKVQGNGGKVVLWSDVSTRFYGSISARGGEGGGDGGQAEVSSKGVLEFAGTGDLRAPKGKAGELLLDPTNLTIRQTANPNLNGDGSTGDDLASLNLLFGAAGTNSVITPGAVVGQLDLGAVKLQATNKITVEDAIDKAGGNTPNSLTLQAGGDIEIQFGATIKTTGLLLQAHGTGGAGAPPAQSSGRVTVSAALDAGSGALVISGSNGHSIAANLAADSITITGNVDTSGTRTFTTGTAASSIAGTVNMANNLTLDVGSGGMTITGDISDTGSRTLTKNGSGTLALGGTSSYSALAISSGTVQVGLGGTAGSIGTTPVSGSGTLAFNRSDDISYSAILSGGLSLAQLGTGTLILTGNNTYTGKTSIQNGTLSVSSINNVGSPNASSNLGRPTSVSNGTIDLGSGATTGTLIYTGTGETTDRVINLAGTTGGGVIDQSGTSGLLKFTSALTATGAGSKALTLQGSAAGTGEFAGVIADGSGTTALTKAGSGTWGLSAANTYSGNTAVTSTGTLKLLASDVLPQGASKGNVSVASGATLDLNGFSDAINGLSGAGTVDNVAGGGASTLTVGNNDATSSFSGVLKNTSGTLALTKVGIGTLTLTGTNTYGGRTSIQDGAVSVATLNTVNAVSGSNLGQPLTSGNGTIDLGSGTTTGTLIYTGTGETTDRVINLAGTTGGATLDQSGTGPSPPPALAARR
jgi:filamentous hemagglutinin family protein